MKWIKRASGALALLIVVIGGAGWLWLRTSLPQIDGEIRLPGLEAPVEIIRDRNAIPHIRARSEADAYLAALRSNPHSPPTDVKIDAELLSHLLEQGEVVRTSPEVVFEAKAYAGMVDRGPSLSVIVAASAARYEKPVPSHHMRCRMTASLRA